ncbi:HAD family hydrolase [Mesobacillus jeotgali]|uniref:HAD family hydrolase n=1 Tax=Mesobacillus jeotgali TaxID=129985 RepID=UPI001CFE1F82|nr:HAD-IA family hydrolase [Mesobacillus jeotgali]
MKSSTLNYYDVIIFDCDGVLIDVNQLKSEAFGKAVDSYPSEVVERFVNYCKESFGVSRYVKFEEFFNFAEEPFQEEKYKSFLNNYAMTCVQIYKNAEITPGCVNLLTELSNYGKELYVASGSDEKELNQVFIDRRLSKFFKGIFGSPKTKLECTNEILERNPGKKAVFIGDALSDMKTAKEVGIDYIYMPQYSVQTKSQDFICRKEAKLVINTLEHFLDVS